MAMDDRDQFGCAIIALNIITIVVTGIITWNCYTPSDFLQMVCFLVIWAISSYFARKIVMFLFLMFMNAIKK